MAELVNIFNPFEVFEVLKIGIKIKKYPEYVAMALKSVLCIKIQVNTL